MRMPGETREVGDVTEVGEVMGDMAVGETRGVRILEAAEGLVGCGERSVVSEVMVSVELDSREWDR